MPFNGSGSFSPPGSDFPAVAQTLIESSKFNAIINDIATGLSTAICKDGQTTITANIPFSGRRITGLGAPAATGDALREGSPVGGTTPAAGTFTTLTMAAEPVAALQAVPARDLGGQLYGLTLSNNGSDATNDIDIATGTATDSTLASIGRLASAMTKRLDANWAAGTNQGGRYSGAAIANTTYGAWLVWTAAGTADIYFYPNSGAPSAATVLAALQAETGGASYAFVRYIGSIMRESNAIVAFVQVGDDFTRTAGAVQNVSASNPGTSAATATLSVPIGVVVEAKLSVVVDSPGTGVIFYLSALSTTDVACDATNATIGISNANGDDSQVVGTCRIITNTSAQIRYRGSASGAGEQIRINTQGWIDRRGRDA